MVGETAVDPQAMGGLAAANGEIAVAHASKHSRRSTGANEGETPSAARGESFGRLFSLASSPGETADATAMTCSVVIPCHNRSDLTRACVTSLLTQLGGPPREILLVDNGCTDDTGSLAGLAPAVRMIHLPRNLGFAGGVNAGLAQATGDTVLVLNNDTRAAPNLLHELHHALSDDPTIAAAAPVSNRVKGHAEIQVRGDTRDAEVRARIATELAAAPTIQDATTLSGLCLLLHRSALDRVGVFDERFGTGNFEDDDLCLRLRLHGYRLVLARRAFLHHEGSATFHDLGLDIAREMADKQRRFAAKWRQEAAGRAVLAAMAGEQAAAGRHAAMARLEWPLWADAHWHLATAAAAGGDQDQAVAHFRALLRQCPRHVDAALALGHALLQRGDHAEGQQLLATLAAEPMLPTQAAYRLEALGRSALQRDDAKTAIQCFAAALDLVPDPAGTLQNLLGVSWLQRADLDQAETCFASAAATGNARACGNLGICRHRRGDRAGARASFARAVELAPDDALARANYDMACAAT